MKNRVEEIRTFIEYKDFDLARRRLLDACLDTRKESLIQQSINFSKLVDNKAEQNSANFSDKFQDGAEQILQQFSSLSSSVIHTNEQVISANKISKSYTVGGFNLQALSLKAYTNKIIGVVGENGHGKTTLLRCLAGQLQINEGSIDYYFDPKPDYFSIKQKVAFIPQRIPKWYGKLKDNLHFSASITGNYSKENNLMVDFMLERLSLTSYANLTWSQISSGYRTRFEIARVLLQKPTLLILDEPLANLDINAQQTMLIDFKYLAKSIYYPLSIILSSQQLHEVEKVADEILFIKNGNSIFQTTCSNNVTHKEVVIEIETNANRDTILQILENNVQVSYNGGYYTITSNQLTANVIMEKLLAQQIAITYFRDITNSTKRLFS